MEIRLEEIRNACLCIGNSLIEGKIVEINPSTRKVLFEFNPDSIIKTLEIGKQGEVFFEYQGKRYLVAGKIFFQPPSKALIIAATNIEIDRRKDTRKETPSLLASISYTSGIFKKKYIIKSILLNISIKGAQIETPEQLDRNLYYDLETSLPYHHSKLDFKATFVIKTIRPYHNRFRYGVQFTDMDMIFEKNLRKYLFRS